MNSKSYERYQLHPKKKLLEALADLIPESGGWILICDEDKIMSFDVDSSWDYGSSNSIVDLAKITNQMKALQKLNADLQTEIYSKSKKVANYNKRLGLQ